MNDDNNKLLVTLNGSIGIRGYNSVALQLYSLLAKDSKQVSLILEDAFEYKTAFKNGFKVSQTFDCFDVILNCNISPAPMFTPFQFF